MMGSWLVVTSANILSILNHRLFTLLIIFIFLFPPRKTFPFNSLLLFSRLDMQCSASVCV